MSRGERPLLANILTPFPLLSTAVFRPVDAHGGDVAYTHDVERCHDVAADEDQSNDGRLYVDEAKRQVDQRSRHEQRETGQFHE